MKKNKNIFMASVLLLSLGLASCTDSFLDVTSKTESSTGTFYKTEKDAYRALIGCYDGWRQTSSAMMVGFYMAFEGDECRVFWRYRKCRWTWLSGH